MYAIAKLELFKEWRKHTKEERNSLLCDFILKGFARKKKQLKIASISTKLAEKWTAANRKMNNFLNKNKSWLEGDNLEFKISLHRFCASTTPEGSRPQGWSKNNFED